MDIVRHRLANQFLTTRGPETASEVVAALGAVQAQDYSGAIWALGQRVQGGTESDIDREFAGGSILRTHVLRPTWHFVSPADIRWMLALTAPRVKAALASQHRTLELTDGVVRRSNRALAKALAGGKYLTRTELRFVLERARIGVITTQRLAHLMARAELDAAVCSGPRRGKQFTYALLEERVPPAAALSREDALIELARRYFATRGPATAQDFAWWSGLTMADVRHALAAAGRVLLRENLGGREYVFTERRDTSRTSSAHLLPNYDEYFIGFRDRTAIGRRLRSVERVIGGNALIANVVVVDGQLVGGWKRALGRDGVDVKLELADRLTPREQQLVSGAIRRYGAFLGRAAVSAWRQRAGESRR